MVITKKKRIYRKRIPYGMQNFEDIRKRDCYYVDKTPFIEEIEDSNMMDLNEIWARAKRFDVPTNTITDPVPVLFQSGYLTIKGYDKQLGMLMSR